MSFFVFSAIFFICATRSYAQVTPPQALIAARQALASALESQAFARAEGYIKWPLKVIGASGVRPMTPSAFASYMNEEPSELGCLRNAPLTQGAKRTLFGAKNWFATCKTRTYEFNRIRTQWRLTQITDSSPPR